MLWGREVETFVSIGHMLNGQYTAISWSGELLAGGHDAETVVAGTV